MAYPSNSATVAQCHHGAAGLAFNSAKPFVMHIDLNSCFASVEQQANPLLRGKPVVVTNTTRQFGCILASSVEAKLYGVKTGMTLEEGYKLCPFLIVRLADPNKYRQVHHDLGVLFGKYSPQVTSLSIDEYCLDLSHLSRESLRETATSIKSRVKHEIGSYLCTSVGLSTNRNLAKLASGLNKPDGLDTIDASNYAEVFSSIKLQDFCGINTRNEARLNRVGIFTALQFSRASLSTLTQAFESVLARYWYTRLRGYEVDNVEFSRGSFGQSAVLPRPLSYTEWRPVLARLAAKASRRLRRSGYLARGAYLALSYSDHSTWHASHKSAYALADDPSLLSSLLRLYVQKAPQKSVKKLALSFFVLEEESPQLALFTSTQKSRKLRAVLDEVNDKWGEYSLAYASLLGSAGYVRDAIAFGK